MNCTNRVTILALASFAAMTSATAAPAGYAAHRTITFSGYEGATTLEKFPALVKLPAAYFRTEARQDVAFADSDGNRIPHEVDSFTDSEVLVWVRVPELTGKNTSITAYFGRPAPEATEFEVPDVWTNAYVAVWHLNTDATDATGHGLALTSSSGNSAKSSGPLGNFIKLGPGEGAGIWCSTPKQFVDSRVADPSKVTLSGWFKPSVSGKPNHAMRLFSWKDQPQGRGFDSFVHSEDGKLYMRGDTSSDSSPTYMSTAMIGWSTESWSHVVVRYDATSFSAFLNGSGIQMEGSTSSVSIGNGDNTARLGFGNKGGVRDMNYSFYDGQIDELRFYNGAASDDWIKAERDTVANADFAEYGDVVQKGRVDGTWTSSAANANWSDAANWQNGGIPYSDEDTVTFDSPSGNQTQTVVLEQNVFMSSVVQSDSVYRSVAPGLFSFTAPASVSVAEDGTLVMGAVVTNGLSKTGLGTLCIDLGAAGVALTGTVSVAEGALAFLPAVEAVDPTLVDEGNFEPATSLAGGGGQADHDRRCSRDSGYFESNLTSWTFGSDNGDNGSGLCCNDSYFSNNSQIAANGAGGAHAAFLRKLQSTGTGVISRSVVTDVDNAVVTVEFQFNVRWYSGMGADEYWYAKVGVLFDGQEVYATDSIRSPQTTTASTSDISDIYNWRTCTVSFVAPTPGTHTLAFTALTPNYGDVGRNCEALIDNVKVGMNRAVTGQVSRFTRLSLDFASGSRLKLGTGVDVRVRDVSYGGVRLKGDITAETHPEFVSGSGRMRVGGGLVVVCH